MKYCCQCASELIRAIPEGDDVERQLCPDCGYVAYQNPNVLVSVMMNHGDKLLWMRRDCEPRRGYWGMPAGFMECGESLAEAAVRELREETGVDIAPDKLTLYAIGSITYTSEVYVAFRAEMASPEFCAGAESQEVALFSEDEVPWQDLAFGVVEPYVRDYYRDLKSNRFGLYVGDYNDDHKVTENILPDLLRQALPDSQ
ncbi:NADH pyrophosphatase [Sinobacterium norvegicum]|uniref:NADH pyrophosphatase n=1 Tax=Sinobacterium norvegicum TaxID=1641715 RepID=A0ABN8EIV4_9GAMM|nr:NUDIX hydrolase [Sinobacterium norvegicum]CAH0991984.1 NADH pyrophosphatase [Sinobacterium norvegicum]